jgi:hypothetical protein
MKHTCDLYNLDLTPNKNRVEPQRAKCSKEHYSFLFFSQIFSWRTEQYWWVKLEGSKIWLYKSGLCPAGCYYMQYNIRNTWHQYTLKQIQGYVKVYRISWVLKFDLTPGFIQISIFILTSHKGNHGSNMSYRNLHNRGNKMDTVITITMVSLAAMLTKVTKSNYKNIWSLCNKTTTLTYVIYIVLTYSCKMFILISSLTNFNFFDKLQYNSTIWNDTKARPVDTRCFMWTIGRTSRHYDKNPRFPRLFCSHKHFTWRKLFTHRHLKWFSSIVSSDVYFDSNANFRVFLPARAYFYDI